MAQLIENQITAHETAVDLLKAIKQINESIDALDPNREDLEDEKKRYYRQQQILVGQYNEITKPIWPLSIDYVEPIELDDDLFSEKLQKHITPRLMNCLRHYFRVYHFPSIEAPTVRNLFDVDENQFPTIRNVGVGTMNELARFIAQIKRETLKIG